MRYINSLLLLLLFKKMKLQSNVKASAHIAIIGFRTLTLWSRRYFLPAI